MLLWSCRKDKPDDNVLTTTPSNPEYQAGGHTTVYDQSSEAYSSPIANADNAVLDIHNNGAFIFSSDFSLYGTSELDGLGPLFIQSSCIGCHPGNGRSQPPLSEVDYDSGLLMRFSLSGSGIHGEPNPLPGFGTQLQTRAIDGELAEGHFIFSYNNNVVTYEDGSTVILHNPSHEIINPYISMPSNILYSMRNASPIYGLGLLEVVNESDILSRVDETDANSDNISGKANFVWNTSTQQTELGRFGWKASNPTVAQQVAGAFNEDMGVTSAGFNPIENGFGQSNCTSGFGTEPDIPNSIINLVSFYVQTLAVPAPRNLGDPQVQQGRQIFYDLHCDGCHTTQLQTGESDIPQLSNQEIYPYTDMLIHDMGEVLADGRPDFLASTNEWRTPPLWGIGLTHVVNPNARFLHDGRAATLEEAILWHGGEAHWIIEYFKELPLSDRQALLAFLNAL